MAKPNNRGRTRRSGLLIVGISVLVLLGVGATVIAIGGWKAISSVFARDSAKEEARAGKVAVVVSPVPLPAFMALDPAVFINRNTGDFSVAWVTQKVADEAHLIRDPGPYRGRVLRRDKGAFLAFTEADFYPPNTAASPTAAVEPGYRGVWLSTQDVDGLEKLKRFDRVDMFAVISVRPSRGHDGDVVYTPETAAALASANEWKTERRVVAQNARIIVPAPTEKGSRANECFVAIRDEEVTAVLDAIAKKATILCMARSGLPGGDLSTFVDEDTSVPTDSISVTSGKNTWKVTVPASKNDGAAPDGEDDEPRK